MRSIVYCLTILLSVVLVGCEDLSGVENTNSPDREQVLGTQEDIEGLAGDTFQNYWSATMWCDGSMMLSTVGDSHSANWANWGMNAMSSEPRIAWNNDPGFPRAASNEVPWFESYTGISNAIDVLQNTEESALPKAHAFSNFSMGLMFGHIAARYDQAFDVPPDVDFDAVAAGEEELDIVPYEDVRARAISSLDEAIRIAENNDFIVADDWIYGTTLSSTNLARLARSMKAKFLAMSARTPEERQNLPWGEIKTLIENGMEAQGYTGPFGEQESIPGTPQGFQPFGDDDGSTEFDCQKSFAQSNIWGRADYKTIGPADTTGGFEDWLSSEPVPDRVPYNTGTPDRRIQGEGINTNGKYTVKDPLSPDETFVGFPPARGTNHYSDYLPARFRGIEKGTGSDVTFGGGPLQPVEIETTFQGDDFGGSLNGPFTHTTKAEMDLLKAEAILNGAPGSMSEVADLINNTRVENGELSPAQASDPPGSITDDPDPITSRDVVNEGPTFEEATLYSMMKHEFNIETMLTSSGLAFFTRRGWDYLPEGTPRHYPIPGEELNTLGLQKYTFGGVGGRCAVGNTSNCIGDLQETSASNSRALNSDVSSSTPSPPSVKK